MNQLQQEWSSVQNATNEKFLIVGKELRDLRKATEHLAEIQRSNVKILQTQFDTLASSINYMRNCDQFLYIREEVNDHIGLLNSILTSVYTNLRTYRSALFAFRMNILSSTTAIADGMLPLSLIPRKIFIRILQQVLLETRYTRYRLTLSIPIEHVMSYYETRLVTSVVSVDFGLMLTLSIPFSSGSTA